MTTNLSRLLVVEDERAMRLALTGCLEAEGYRVISAVDGEEGLTKAIHEKPALILLDIMLPKLDGFALCAELRRLGHAVPVLMLTAKGQVEDRVTGLDAGADDYLVKPFSMDELLARSPATASSMSSGGMAPSRPRARSIITSPACGPKSSPTPNNRAGSSPCTASDIGWKGRRQKSLSPEETRG